MAAIAAVANNYSFDVTGDGLLDYADLNEWLAQAGAANLASGNPYLPADANLDGTVDAQDFVAWNDHKFTSVAAWCSGDFNADGVVDAADFVIWNDHKYERDLTQWLELGGAANIASGNPYLPGDANLDGLVDGQDWIDWYINKFTNNLDKSRLQCRWHHRRPGLDHLEFLQISEQ